MFKVRYSTRCARCRDWMLPGVMAERFLGGTWHPLCAAQYRQQRQEMLVSR